MPHERKDSIEIDPAILANYNDDYLDIGVGMGTLSLSSSINEYVFENGRRYHAYFGPDKNLLPTDETEKDRLDIHHEVFLLLLDQELHKAPLKNPKRILDVGTGTGIWAIEMADKYPHAEVIGTDLTPMQPGWVPPNCRFEMDDVELDWLFPPNSFDFIHARNITQCISNWPKLMSQIYDCTKPGGYAELAEAEGIIYSDDGSMKDDNGYKIFLQLLSQAMEKSGRPRIVSSSDMEGYLRNAGFIDIKVVSVQQPWGPWPKNRRLKKIGAMNLLNAETAFHAYGMAAFTRVLGMSTEEAEHYCREGSRAVGNKNNHIYNYFNIVYARKPLDGEGMKGMKSEKNEK